VTDTANVVANQLITLRETNQTGVPDEGGPGVARLLAAYPNPFRSSTTISYDLSAPSPVRLFVVDPTGRLLRVLETSDLKDPGNHVVQWDGKTDDGREAAQGVYYYSLAAGGVRRSLPVILLR
jgi:flagellar hook assembly protein FlgD